MKLHAQDLVYNNDMLLMNISNLLKSVDWDTLDYHQVQFMLDVLYDNHNTAECEMADRKYKAKWGEPDAEENK